MKICLAVSYLYNHLLVLFYYRKVLQERYSFKMTLLATLVLWAIQCIFKLLLSHYISLKAFVYGNFFALFLSGLYVILLFKDKLAKKMAALFLSYMVMLMLENISINLHDRFIKGALADYGDFAGVLSLFMITNFLIGIGILLLAYSWKLIEKIVENIEKYQLLIGVFPLSQYILFMFITNHYYLEFGSIPLECIAGGFLAVLADIYMIFLFYRINQRKKAEKEFRKLQYEYSLEQIHYEQLKDKYEELVKIRHDYQNYLLMVKNLQE